MVYKLHNAPVFWKLPYHLSNKPELQSPNRRKSTGSFGARGWIHVFRRTSFFLGRVIGSSAVAGKRITSAGFSMLFAGLTTGAFVIRIVGRQFGADDVQVGH